MPINFPLLNRLIGAALVAIAAQYCAAQSVIINEVSNGPAGNQEYMELVVVPTTTDPCAPAPCLDLRNWLIDDNNGYHGSVGTAPGVARFRDHPLWSCVPVGTIILLYNGGDPNPLLPPDNAVLGPGVCSLVLSLNDLDYFEFTNTTPTAALCSYPTTGWGSDPTPTWLSNIALANTGDCVIISDLSGCQVSSLCYGNANANQILHFPGGGGQRVWWFNSGDPAVAANWSFGCTTAGCVGTQTPGAPNNVANAEFIGLLNNYCSPLPIESFTVQAEAADACDCNGTATATASSPGGTFVWYDAAFNAIGTPGPNATGLCPGIYYIIGTSAGACVDTATVEVGQIDPPDAGLDGALELCTDATPTDLFAALNGTPQPGGTWTPSMASGSGIFDPQQDPAGAYQYAVTGTTGCPPSVSTVNVSIASAPVILLSAQNVSCWGEDDGVVSVSVQGTSAPEFIWSNGLPPTSGHSGLSPGTYTVIVSNDIGCATTDSIEVLSPDPIAAEVSLSAVSCAEPESEACVAVQGGTGAYALVWSGPAPQAGTCASGIASGDHSISITDQNGCELVVPFTVPEVVNDLAVDLEVTNVSCAGVADGSIDITLVQGGNVQVQWNGPGGYNGTGTSVANLAGGTYTYAASNDQQCTLTGTVDVLEPDALVLSASVVQESCLGACDGSIVASVSGGVPPFTLLLDNSPMTGNAAPALCATVYLLQVIDASGCNSELTVMIEQGPVPTAPGIEVVPELCETDAPIQLIADITGGVWSGTGITDPLEGTFSPAISGPGTFLVSYLPPGPCRIEASVSVSVLPAPIASFSATDGGSAPWNFTNTSSNGMTFIWTLGGVAIGNDQDLLLDASDLNASTFEVCLIAFNALDCSDTACTSFIRTTRPTIHVPNAFTPNGDGINDLFGAELSGVLPDRFTLLIFDRWGGLVFETRDPSARWNGLIDGQPAADGVYPWRILMEHDGSNERIVGHVVVLR